MLGATQSVAIRIASTAKGLRPARGFSLIYVMSIGSIALLAALAMTSSIITINRDMAGQLYENELRSAAENGIQYTLNQLNTAAQSGNVPNPYPAVTPPPAMTNGIAVTVTVTSLNLSSFPYLAASPVINPANSNGTISLIRDYRELQATAIYSGTQRTITALVGPNYFPNSAPNPASTPFFNGALTANTSLTINGVNVLLAGNASMPTSPIVNSNQNLTISGASVNISGSISAFNSTGTGTSALTIPTISGSNPAVTIGGNVYVSTNSPSAYSSSLIPDPSSVQGTLPNVLGDGQYGQQPGEVFTTTTSPTPLAATPIAPAQSVSANQQALATTPNAGTTSYQSPAVVGTETGVADVGSIVLTGSQTQTVSFAPGQYVTNSINLGSNSNINLTGAGAAQQPVQLYVQGDTPAVEGSSISPSFSSAISPINITGSFAGISNASNFQIFYGGTQAVNIRSPNFYGLIYAPNAAVYVDTSLGDFNGAVVANSVTVQGAHNFVYDPSSISPKTNAPNVAPGPGYALSPGGAAQSYNLLSWQETTFPPSSIFP